MCTTGGHFRQSWPYIALECFKYRLHSLWCSLENGFLLKQLIKTFHNILLVCHLLSFLHLVFLQKNSPYGKSKDSNEWWIIKQVQKVCQGWNKPCNGVPITLPRRKQLTKHHVIKIKLENSPYCNVYQQKINTKFY